MTRRASHHRTFLSLVACLAVVLATSSCGTFAYNRAWESFDAVADGDPMVGRWQGDWESESNGHSGGLRCMLTRVDEGAYFARFHSTYGWFFFFRHETTFHITGEEEGTLRFEGAEDLGKAFGGLYRYTGTVAGDRFEARFEAENDDFGVFRMQRVE